MNTKSAKTAASEGTVRESTMRLGRALGRRALHELSGKMNSATENLMTFGHSEDSKPAKRGDGDGDEDRGGAAETMIIETVDVGVPVDVAYDQWTRFTDFPGYMKTVEHVAQNEDDELTWRARMFWVRRTWTSTIVDQTPDERIAWRSEGPKGYVDGSVGFHPLAPSLTRVVLVLDYHPKGLVEHLGNLVRAQTRRARKELKRFQEHVMTQDVPASEEPEDDREPEEKRTATRRKRT